MSGDDVKLQFLGTSSAPSGSRNYSSLVVHFDSKTSVMVDCGEGTQQQINDKRIGGDAKVSSIQVILITHLHQDHVLGLAPLLTTLLGPSAAPSHDDKPRVHIFGPLGLRALLRTQLTLCYTTLNVNYTVHELLWPDQQPTGVHPQASTLETDVGLAGSTHGPRRVIPQLPLHSNEVQGRDIFLDPPSASWPNIAELAGFKISAAPILHRAPTVGYIFAEAPTSSPIDPRVIAQIDAQASEIRAKGISNHRSLVGKLIKERKTIELPDGTKLEPPPLDVPGRKLVILGDTCDASGGLGDKVGLVPLAQDADILVHESTNAHIDPAITGNGKKGETLADVTEKATSRGHSTPQGAGAFAGRINAQQLLLNHFSVRYPAPPPWLATAGSGTGNWHANKAGSQQQLQTFEKYRATMRSFEDQATAAWHNAMPKDAPLDAAWHGKRAIATHDGYIHSVPRKLPGQMLKEQANVPPVGSVNTGVSVSTGQPSAKQRNKQKYWSSIASTQSGGVSPPIRKVKGVKGLFRHDLINGAPPTTPQAVPRYGISPGMAAAGMAAIQAGTAHLATAPSSTAGDNATAARDEGDFDSDFGGPTATPSLGYWHDQQQGDFDEDETDAAIDASLRTAAAAASAAMSAGVKPKLTDATDPSTIPSPILPLPTREEARGLNQSLARKKLASIAAGEGSDTDTSTSSIEESGRSKLRPSLTGARERREKMKSIKEKNGQGGAAGLEGGDGQQTGSAGSQAAEDKGKTKSMGKVEGTKGKTKAEDHSKTLSPIEDDDDDDDESGPSDPKLSAAATQT